MGIKSILKLYKYVIDKVKVYAASQKRSLLGRIEFYLKSMISKDKNQSIKDIEISPFVKSLRTGVNIPFNYDYKKDYGDYLLEKYK
jgi:hypothetical protein